MDGPDEVQDGVQQRDEVLDSMDDVAKSWR